MKKVLKWTGIILLVLIAVVTGAYFYLTGKADQLMAKKMTVDPPVFQIPDDSISIAAGAKFAVLCTECHGERFEGKAFFDDPKLGRIYAPNLTKGKGGAVGGYTDRDWILALRHGVRANGDALLVMPSKDYYYMSQRDISSLIAYMKTVEPVDNETGKNHMTGMGKILLALGAFGEVHSADLVDHSKGPGNAPAEGSDAAYGDYLVKISGCRTCHGEMLNGGKHPDPNAPLVPNLTPAGNMGSWNEEQFISTFRSGTTPEGKKLNPKFMPYTAYAGLSDGDLKAVYSYLKGLASVPTPK